MRPKEFPEQNIVFAKDQPQYNQLPSHKAPDGTVTMCIELSEEDKKAITENGVFWIQLLTFNHPLQPIRAMVKQPEMPRNVELEQYLHRKELEEQSSQKVKDRMSKRELRIGKNPKK